MEIIDYLKTDNIIVVKYPQYAGGKFLINCLGLSNQAVFQDIELAKLQIGGNFPPEKKINLLLQRLDDTKNQWNDLNLGCYQLFDQNFANGNLTNNINDDVKLLIVNKLFFFIVAHTDDALSNILTIWPNAKIIYIVNYQSFTDTYRTFISDRYKNIDKLQQGWNKIKKPGWPKDPPASVQSLTLFSKEVVEELHNEQHINLVNLIFNDNCRDYEYTKSLDKIKFLAKNSKWIEIFDAKCYLDENIMVKQISDMYKKLELLDFNEQYIKQYYRNWIKKLVQIQNEILANCK
jgi:hypothetical protein